MSLLNTFPKGCKFNYNRPEGLITMWMIALVTIHVVGEFKVNLSEPCKTEQDLEIALRHLQLVKSWNLWV